MAETLTIQVDQDLLARTTRLAAKRGISINQLVEQQLERAVANDEYNTLKQKVQQPRTTLKQPKPAQRALKRAR